MSHVEKRVQFLWVMLKKGFNSVSCIRKRGSILWMKLKKSILGVILKKRLGSLSHISKRRFNSLSRITERFNSLSHLKKKPFFKNILWVLFFCKRFNSASHIFWTRPDDRMIIPDKFQTHRINDLIHQDQTEKAKHWKRSNNSRKPHSGPRWDSMRNNGWPKHDAEDRSELHTLQSRAKCVRSRDLRRCRLSQFSCACLNPCLGLVQGRLPKCISSHCPMAPDNKPHKKVPTRILRQKGWGSPRLLVPTFRSRRLCRQIALLNTVYVNQQSRRSNKRQHH